MTLSELETLLAEPGRSDQERQRIIKLERCRLLDEIHLKQQQLDRLDYMLYKLKNGGINDERI